VAGTLSVGDLTFLAASFLRLRGLLEGLLTGFSTTAGQALYLDDLFSFFRAVPGIRSAPDALPFPGPIEQGFVFEDVGFRYPDADRWAVRHLSFELRLGEVLALVIENGAGKTTPVKLLARLYDPAEGRVLLDGWNLRDYDLEALRSAVGVIFQDFVRYSLPASDNIAVGRIEARGDRGRIEAAAATALADDVVAKLPGGYDQMIGKRFGGGVDLSGGEWQKMAIARLHARRPCADPGRAHRGAGGARRISGVRAVPRSQCWPLGGADLAPLLQRAHGRLHPSAGRRPRGGVRHARRAVRAAGGRVSVTRPRPPGGISPGTASGRLLMRQAVVAPHRTLST